MLIGFTIYGLPYPQPRVHVTRTGRAYYPDKAGKLKAWRRAIAAALLGNRRDDLPLQGPIRLALRFYLPRPQRLLRKSSPPGPVWCDVKPDLTNLEKVVEDALERAGWFRNDSQIVCQNGSGKWFVERGGRSRCEVEIETLED